MMENLQPPRLKSDAREAMVSKAVAYAIVFYLGWVASQAYYNLNHLWTEQATLKTVEHVQIPRLKRDEKVVIPSLKRAATEAKKQTSAPLRPEVYGGKP